MVCVWDFRTVGLRVLYAVRVLNRRRLESSTGVSQYLIATSVPLRLMRLGLAYNRPYFPRNWSRLQKGVVFGGPRDPR